MKTPSKNDIARSVEAHCEEQFAFIQQLVRTPSLPGDEQKVQWIIAEKLQSLGLVVEAVESKFEEVQTHPAFCDDGIPFTNRLNVIGRWPAKNNLPETRQRNGRSLILNGHVDVVSPGNESFWDDSPWSGRIANGRLFGRGACDMKAGLSAAIFAVQALQNLGLQPAKDVLIESVIGEESGGVGTLTTLIKGFTADAAIIMEPTRLRLCTVQSGALTFRLKIQGKAAHAALKTTGVSAIERLMPIMQVIDALEKKRHSKYRNALFEDPNCIAPISIGTIHGGVWHSSVSEEVCLEGRLGVFPGESIAEAKSQFIEAIMQAAQNDTWLKNHHPKIEWFEGQFESGTTNSKAPIIKLLTQAHAEIIKNPPQIQGVSYGSDLRLFTNHAKIPAVLYGPGDVANAHAVNEFVELDEVIACTKVLALTIVLWCGCD